MCLPSCRGDLPFRGSILSGAFWKQLISRKAPVISGSKAWAAQKFRGVLSDCLLAPRLSWCSGSCGFSGIWPWVPLYLYSFAGELIPACVLFIPAGVLFCAALWSAPLYCSCLFPPTSNGDSFGCKAFPQQSLWCGVGFCENCCFSLSLIFRFAPQTEKCR